MKKCKNCGTDIEMHYVEFCPMCDKPNDKNYRVLDFFRVAIYIAAHEGYNYTQGHHEKWHNQILKEIEFPRNDCFISWCIREEGSWDPEGYNLVLIQFDDGLRKYFNVKDGENILLNISW